MPAPHNPDAMIGCCPCEECTALARRIMMAPVIKASVPLPPDEHRRIFQIDNPYARTREMDPGYAESLRRWLRYFIETEEHDQRVCRMRNAVGEAVPTTAGEHDACARFAAEMRGRLELDRWPYAKHEAGILSLAHQREWLAALTVDGLSR